MTSLRATVVTAAAVLMLGGCGVDGEPRPTASPPATAADGGAPVDLAGDPDVVSGRLDAPWAIAFVDGTALVSARDSGEVLEVLDDGSTRIIGTIDGVRHGGEGGLLGLAVSPDEHLYAYSTGTDGNRVQRFALTGDPGQLGLGPAENVLEDIPAASNHNGGRIAFGPDGMLYVTTGDAGEREAAQDPQSLAGKILRITPDGSVPEDNPIAGSAVFSLGHRNPQGIAWAADGTLFAAEFGQDTWDELNIITAGGNYGWPDVEGIADDGRYIDPVQQWSPDVASPSGIAIVGGTIFVANLRGEVLRAVPVADPTTSTDLLAGEFGRLRDVVVSPDGDLWFLTNNTDGRGEPGDADDRLVRVELEET